MPKKNHHFWLRARRQLLCWALEKYFPHAQSFFEVGCGSGFMLSGLKKLNYGLSLAGSDVLMGGLSYAREQVGDDVSIYQMDASRIPYSEEFDVIGSFDVLEHITEDEEVLAEMYRACKKGGGIILTVPQHPWLWSVTDQEGGHVRRYSREDIKQKVEHAGFTATRLTSFVTTAFPALLLQRLVRRNKQFIPSQEFVISPVLNKILELAINIDLGLIQRGYDLHSGGSLFIVANKK